MATIDYQALFGSEDYDPCALLAVLRPAYMKMVVEKTITRVTFRDRTVEFSPSQSKDLGDLIAQLASECAAKQGRSRPRFAITAGYRRS
jgi:hypothetical protein